MADPDASTGVVIGGVTATATDTDGGALTYSGLTTEGLRIEGPMGEAMLSVVFQAVRYRGHEAEQ